MLDIKVHQPRVCSAQNQPPQTPTTPKRRTHTKPTRSTPDPFSLPTLPPPPNSSPHLQQLRRRRAPQGPAEPRVALRRVPQRLPLLRAEVQQPYRFRAGAARSRRARARRAGEERARGCARGAEAKRAAAGFWPLRALEGGGGLGLA